MFTDQSVYIFSCSWKGVSQIKGGNIVKKNKCHPWIKKEKNLILELIITEMTYLQREWYRRKTRLVGTSSCMKLWIIFVFVYHTYSIKLIVQRSRMSSDKLSEVCLRLTWDNKENTDNSICLSIFRKTYHLIHVRSFRIFWWRKLSERWFYEKKFQCVKSNSNGWL